VKEKSKTKKTLKEKPEVNVVLRMVKRQSGPLVEKARRFLSRGKKKKRGRPDRGSRNDET